ncbi:MAG: phosphatase PAP2 family protein [Nocardioides sp.]
MDDDSLPDPDPHDGWNSEVSSAFALAGFLFVVFIGFTLLAMGPLMSLDSYFNLAPPPPSWVPVLHILDRIGQRAFCLPLLGIVTFWACRRQESWRPAVVVGASVFMLNLIVLILKVGLGRAEPETANPSFFSGGMAYPSGHTSNIVLVYGLIVYVLAHYVGVRRRTVMLLAGVVVLLSMIMVVTSLTLNWHWFADLIAGLVIGGMTLELTAAVDGTVPEGSLDHGPRAALAQLRAAVHLRRKAHP